MSLSLKIIGLAVIIFLLCIGGCVVLAVGSLLAKGFGVVIFALIVAAILMNTVFKPKRGS